MADAPDWWLLLPRPVRQLPADLAATLALVGLTVLAVFVPVVSETPLRVVIGLPFVLFVPGYAFIAALFPEAGTKITDDEAEEHGDGEIRESGGMLDRGIDGIERVALSFGLSIAIVPLIGLILNFTPWGIRLVPTMVAVSGFTVGCVAVAARRRRALPEDEQFHVPYRQWLAEARAELFEPDDRVSAVLNVVLVLSILLAAASVTYAVAVPKDGESFTEFYLLTENESGDLVADDYPTNFTAGESRPLTVGIGNQEHEQTDYTVVVQLQRVDRERVDNQTRVSVEERQELDRMQAQLAHNETWHQPYEVTPRLTGQDLRLVFLLYRGSPPGEPTIENAYRETHLWVNVTEAS
ncbi:DUF1616 domain-containing protein [Salinibaculum salinum]|uniref:DUF1616 domain-containing protein n=1 Tax=Salinibaculum salinum TaxID=3131996 RepID=UPI0030EC0A9E